MDTKSSVSGFLSEITKEISVLEENLQSLGGRLSLVSLQRKPKAIAEEKLEVKTEVCLLSAELIHILDKIQGLNEEVFSIKGCLDI